MSRLPLLFHLSILLSGTLQAQPVTIEDFGAVTREEIDLRKCSFEPGAHAVMLRRDAHVFPNDETMITQVRIRIKILDEKGFDQASIKIPFYSFGGYERIMDVTASTFNMSANGDKEETKLLGKDIFYRPVDKYYGEVAFALPGVRAGSIIEYAYTSIRSSYKMVDYWYLQQEIPVLHSHFDYVVLPNAEFSYRVIKHPEYRVKVEKDNARGKILFDMDDIPGLHDEPFMDSRRDNLQRVELQMNFAGVGLNQERYAATWDELNSMLLKDDRFGLLLEHELPGTQDMIREAKAIHDPERRMDYIFRYVQTRMSWDGYIGIMARDRLKVPWEAKKGSLQEINMILVNLLRNADIRALPVLASDRDHGRVDKQQPFVQQFNKIIAYVNVNGKPHFLDATNADNSLSLVPVSLLNTTGFIVDRKESGFLTIADKGKEARESINGSGKLSADAVLTGEAYFSSVAYSRVELGTQIKGNRDRYIVKSLEEPYPGMHVDSLDVENLTSDSLPLNQIVRYNYALSSTGGYYQLPLTLFTGMSSNPFTSPDRFSDVNFGFQRTLTVNQAMEVSPDLEMQEIPKSTMLMLPDTSLTFQRRVVWNKESRLLTYRLQFSSRRSIFTSDDYSMVREFYMKMYAMLQEPLVLRKK